ncbi:MAG: potassium transporter [Betaproteobacteria bacterium RIFCSPLOWO2_12_FULL_65_110]|nr:MAG: potassium transporter [Betaproteobacteria bacterium RIFCSPLOWO2_02_FULL_65_20]OGA36183.1 MAG: potassium transporter [Betaproteobacteria bacterium RIFCSPLOWO2_12_FULL_65_110]
MTSTLELVLIFLASAVLVVVVFRMLHLPPLLGYLLAGIVIGPHALGWIPESKEGRYLAEFGVVFLMFSIGLEFSLPKLFQMRRTVFGLGLSQVALTLAAGLAACVLAGLGWKPGLVLGGALAMSSTAIVVRMYAERLQLETPHGRQVVGVLLFQDLAVVPLLIVIPTLAQGEGELAAKLAIALGKAAVVLIVLLFVGQKLMRGWFHIVARRRSHELFILNVLLITLGLAWLTELAGLSLALGAFLAGMLIAETGYRHQVEEDIKPFREVLLGLFFVSVGMQLDLRIVRDNLALVAFLFALPVLFKVVLVAGLSRLYGGTPGTALRAGLALGQAGEFGLVIIALAASVGVLERELVQIASAAMLLSMLAAPFLIQYSDRLVLRLATSEWMLRSLELHQIAVKSLATEHHVIICGYGRTGQSLAHLFEREGIRYVALDLDPQHVREGANAGEPVVYGDSTRRETLIAAGIARASALVISFADTSAALRVLHHARELNPGVPVVVRTRDDADLDQLIAAGAAEVVPETFESSLMLASHALVLLGVPLRRVVRSVQEVRNQRYGLLRGFFHGESDEADSGDEARELRLHSVRLDAGSYAAGKVLRELALEASGARLTVLRRVDARISSPPSETVLEEGDVLVLLGTGDQLEAAEIRLLRG